jgi:hypothetical protein
MLKLDEPPEKIETAKQYIENVLKNISSLERDLFSYSEVENLLLDIYNFVVSQ